MDKGELWMCQQIGVPSELMPANIFLNADYQLGKVWDTMVDIISNKCE